MHRLAAAPRRPALLRRAAGPRCALLPLLPLRPTLPSSLHQPGVYVVYDAGGAAAYCGLSRNVSRSLAGHAAALPEQLAAAAAVRLMPGASGAELQAAWREEVAAAGGPPPGNLPGGDARWTARPPPPPPLPAWDGDAERWRSQTPLLAPETLASLVGRGFAVQDGFLPPPAVAAAAAAAAALRPRLRFSQLQRGAGRGDSFTTLRLAAPGATSLTGDLPLGEAGQAELAEAAGRLMALAAELAPPLQRSLAPPQLLQLACYDDGAGYAAHEDNPGRGSPAAEEGPPGWRAVDRSVTAILYLNPGWAAESGGALRLWPPGGGSALDFEPLGGRLLLFESAGVLHQVMPSHAPRFALSAWLPRGGSAGVEALPSSV